jgi:sigma-B regulation protein RsbU (phosphoserine phosphatase)
MPISPAELRGMFRADVVGLVLGALLMLIGLLIAAVVGMVRRRALPLLWLGAFALLYGFRLLVRTDTFRLYFDLPNTGWDRTDAALTYAVPIPIALFLRASFPAWRRLLTPAVLALTVFAVCGIAADALLDQSHSALMANNVIAIGFFVSVLVWIFRPGLKSSPELHTMRVGASAVSATAVADNLRGVGALAFPGPDVEPFGFTILITCLGAIAVRRALDDAQRLVVIERELSIARQIQSAILPQSMPRVAGLTISARYKPMTAVAGDFYDFLEIDAQRVSILVADVSGHGVPAH